MKLVCLLSDIKDAVSYFHCSIKCWFVILSIKTANIILSRTMTGTCDKNKNKSKHIFNTFWPVKNCPSFLKRAHQNNSKTSNTVPCSGIFNYSSPLFTSFSCWHVLLFPCGDLSGEASVPNRAMRFNLRYMMDQTWRNNCSILKELVMVLAFWHWLKQSQPGLLNSYLDWHFATLNSHSARLRLRPTARFENVCRTFSTPDRMVATAAQNRCHQKELSQKVNMKGAFNHPPANTKSVSYFGTLRTFAMTP